MRDVSWTKRIFVILTDRMYINKYIKTMKMEWVKTSFITNSFMWHTLFIKYIKKDMPQSSDTTCNWLKMNVAPQKNKGIKCQLDWLVMILGFAMGQYIYYER